MTRERARHGTVAVCNPEPILLAVLEGIRNRNREKDPEHVESDVAAAVEEVRAAPRTKSRKRA